jgi:uncharacterized protein YegL
MAKFSDLSEQERIQYIKDGFVLLLEELAKDPSKLKSYIKLEMPALNVAAFEPIVDWMTDEQKTAVTNRNKIVKEKVDAANEKIIADYKVKEDTYKKIESIVSGIKKKEGCICGSCININITSSIVPRELELLIDIARKEAEERTY